MTFNRFYPNTVLINKKIKMNKVNFHFYLIYIFNSKKDLKHLFNNKKLIFFIKPNINA